MKRLTTALTLLVLAACSNSDYSGTDSSFATLAVSSLTLGEFHTCVGSNYGNFCWGSNPKGELGDESNAHSSIPVRVHSADSYTGLSAGTNYTCGLDGTGVKCWGFNYYGTLGTNAVPSVVDGSCGLGTACASDTPVAVEQVAGGNPLSGITQIAAGSSHVCARTSAGGAICWGNNGSGEIGNGNTTTQEVPAQVSGLTTNVTAVAVGQQHSCAIVSGALRCWGENGSGQLGNNSTTDSSTSVAANVLTANVTAVSLGQLHSCAIMAGAAYCWGDNSIGQLGDGTTTNRLVPTAVSGLGSGVTAISVGVAHTCAIHNGAAKCWGYTLDGQIGDGSYGFLRSSPVQVTGLDSGVTAIAAGNKHSCAVQGTKVYCWGGNDYGQLGTGDNVGSAVPVEVEDPSME
jgi:alpha-tubulin suppressor-like RCC1 family protein